MAKPVELILTLEGEAALRFWEYIENPPENPALEALIEEAKKIQIE